MLKKTTELSKMTILNIFMIANLILLNKTSESGNVNSDLYEYSANTTMTEKNCLMCADYKKTIGFQF